MKKLSICLTLLSTMVLLLGCDTGSETDDDSDNAVIERVTDDPIEAAYYGVYVWKAAVEKAGTFDVDKVRQAVYGLEFDAPGGKKRMHDSNQHTLKPVYVGEILKNGQFKIVWESDGLVSPDSYSRYLHPDGNYPKPTGGPKKKG